MNFDFNDDGMSDRLDYLSDRYEYFFSWLESLLDAPSEMVDMEPEHWEDFVTEPSAAELAQMDESAALLLADIFGDEL